MIENLLTVAGQVGILFILIAVGYLCGKTEILKEKAIKGITDFVLYVVTPAAVLQAFMNESRTTEKTVNLLWVCLFTVIAHLIAILLATLFIRTKDKNANRILRFAAVFSNCGYMSFPLQKALLGDIGVFYGSMFVAVFYLFIWSYGIWLCSGDKKSVSPKKIITNPVIISVILSLILYLTGLKLPTVLSGAVTHLGNMNTPLPMVIIGYHLYNAGILKSFTDKRIYLPVILRLLAAPALLLLFMKVCGVTGIPLVACTIAACAPTAAISTMFAHKSGLDAQLSVKVVTVTTLLSIITMPLFVVLAQTI